MRRLWIALVSALAIACGAPGGAAVVSPAPAPATSLLITEPAALAVDVAGPSVDGASDAGGLLVGPDEVRSDAAEPGAAAAATCVDGRGVERPAGHWMCRAIHGQAPATGGELPAGPRSDAAATGSSNSAAAASGALWATASGGAAGSASTRPTALPAPYVRAIPCTSNSDNPRNPYNRVSKDQCTWWAWERRFQIGESLPSRPWGDAKHWLARATAEGFATGTAPRVGAVMVCQPGGCGGAGEVGHVGYVEQVFDATTFRVSEINWGTPCYVDYRIVRMDPAIAFIYGRAG